MICENCGCEMEYDYEIEGYVCNCCGNSELKEEEKNRSYIG